MKNRLVATMLAFIFGSFGVHRFYLRDPGAGVFYLMLFFITGRLFFFPISTFLGFVDGARYLMMSDEEFDRKYNRGVRRRHRRERSRDIDRVEERHRRRVPARQRRRANPFKKSGIKKYKDFDLEEAIVDFKKGLEIDPLDVALHFNIACAYSLTENKELAFEHLSKAVRHGFSDFDRIKNHDDLAFVRIQPEFEAFAENGYQLTPSVKKTKTEDELPKDDVLLSQLNKLAELRKKGLLSEDEFNLERKKLMRRS